MLFRFCQNTVLIVFMFKLTHLGHVRLLSVNVIPYSRLYKVRLYSISVLVHIYLNFDTTKILLSSFHLLITPCNCFPFVLCGVL